MRRQPFAAVLRESADPAYWQRARDQWHAAADELGDQAEAFAVGSTQCEQRLRAKADMLRLADACAAHAVDVAHYAAGYAAARTLDEAGIAAAAAAFAAGQD
jgi:hypothetical protein